jgi:endonuclease/exonuclease/phosphatase family metal-dependent hydrolase
VFTVATFNLLGHQARPTERWPLIVAGITREWPDLLALQEVSAAHDSGRRLQRALNDAAVQAGHRWRYEYAEQANLRNGELSVAILCRHPMLDQRWTELEGQGRVALAVTTEIEGQRLGFVSTHLYWQIGPEGDRARLGQATELRQWVDRAVALDGTPAVVAGDFNATPDSPTYDYLSQVWTSLYAERHGAEPAWTAATPLLPAVSGWQGTLDYLYKAPREAPLRTLDARLFLNEPAPGDATLYPSDHLGVLAHLAFDPDPQRGGDE